MDSVIVATASLRIVSRVPLAEGATPFAYVILWLSVVFL